MPRFIDITSEEGEVGHDNKVGIKYWDLFLGAVTRSEGDTRTIFLRDWSLSLKSLSLIF